MLGIILLIWMSVTVYYIKAALFSEVYTKFEWFIGSIASSIIVILMIIHGADFIYENLIESLVPHKPDTFGHFLSETIFLKSYFLKIMYMSGTTFCCFIPLCKLIKNRYLKFSNDA